MTLTGISQMENHVQIIAEVGSNYDNDINLAKKYIQSAKNIGADSVKFQTLKKDKLIAPKVLLDGKWQPHPAWDNFGNLELSEQWHVKLKKYADSIGIELFSTPFYLEAVELLERIGVKQYKIASGDITFMPLLETIGKTGKPVLLSTGGSTIPDIEAALDTLSRSGSGEITLLHCVSSYPPEFSEVNLKAMVTIRETFNLPVGLSDHSPGSIVPLAAVALGACVIEKHITFDRSLAGPDHPFAMTLKEFSELITQIRLLETALGNGEKVPSESEKLRLHRFRRGIYDNTNYKPIKETNGIWLRPQHIREF